MCRLLLTHVLHCAVVAGIAAVVAVVVITVAVVAAAVVAVDVYGLCCVIIWCFVLLLPVFAK